MNKFIKFIKFIRLMKFDNFIKLITFDTPKIFFHFTMILVAERDTYPYNWMLKVVTVNVINIL
jgi:hypothetical protein